MLLELSIILILSKLMDEAFVRLKQPSVIGEIILGIAISLFAFSTSLNFRLEGDLFDFMAEFGIVSLMFLSGLELNFETIRSRSKCGVMTASLGVVFPILFVFIFSILFLGFNFQQGIVFGSIFVATSVGVTARTLMEFDLIDSFVGAVILTAAVADDIIGILVVTFVLSRGELLEILLGMVIFFVAIYLIFKSRIVEKGINLTHERFHNPYAVTTISIGIMLLLSYFAREFKLASLTGGFIAGLLVGRARDSEIVATHLRTISYSIFIPIFFVKIGTMIDFNHITGIPFIMLFVIPLVFVGKVIGCGLGAKLSGVDTKNSLIVGIGMAPEMEVALIIASMVCSRGYFPPNISTAIIATTILYTMISSIVVPYGLKKILKKESSR